MKWKIIIATIICLGLIFLFIIAPRIGINMGSLLPQFMKSQVLPAGELTSNTLLNSTKDSLKTELNSSQFVISKWDESKFTGYLPLTTSTSTSKDGEIDKVTLTNSIYSSEFYMKDENNFEWEIVLNSRPLRNWVSIPIDLENLNCAYQPPLNEDENNYIDCTETTCNFKDGTSLYRPENIVGSYACYHSSKRDNEYMTGKAFTILRPEVIDSKGNKVWCNLNLTNDRLNISCPSSYLLNAVYPIKIDPTFGYTTAGLTLFKTNSYALTFKANYGRYQAVSGAQVTQLNLYCNGSIAVKGAIYNITQATNIPYMQLGGVSDAMTCPASPSWVSDSHIVNLVAGENYTIAVGDSTGYTYFWYDTGDLVLSRDAGTALDNPWVDGSTKDYLISMYANYTTGGAPSNCWTYEAGTKLLTIPSGCRYNNSQYGI